MDKLSVIGLGKLGACTAACFAAKGFEVTGIDINKEFVGSINAGRAPLVEPNLQEYIEKARGKLRATQDYQEAIDNSDVTFLIVPTPSCEDGLFSNDYMGAALTSLAQSLRKSGKKDHMFVVTSTVNPKACQDVLIPLIERESGRKLNEGFTVCYNPEFIALGSVIHDFLHPDMVLIGESCSRAGQQLETIYQQVCDSNPYVARMSLVSSEITKISLNSYVTLKISYANTLANICEHIPGADVDDITRALGADKRIGPYYLKGGLAFGGPCFPRDNRAFAAFTHLVDYDAKLAKATDEVNQLQVDRMANRVSHLVNTTGENKVAVLGLSYKPNTPVIEESPSIKIIECLLEKENVEVIAYDRLATENARAHFGDRVEFAPSIKECLEWASVCIVTTLDEDFKNIKASDIPNNNMTIIDCWRIMDPTQFENINYIAVGRA